MSWEPGADQILDNGLRLVAVRAQRSPLVEMRLVLPPVSLLITERAEAVLLSHCLAARSGVWTAQLDVDHLVLRTSALPEDLFGHLSRLARALTDPRLGDGLLIRARQAAFAGAPQVGHGLRGELTRTVMRNRFRNHPLSVPAPTREQLLDVTVDRLREAHARMTVPGGSVLFMAGAVVPERAVAAARRHLGRWAGTAAVFDPRIRPRSPVPKPAVHFDDNCVTVVAAAPAPAPTDPAFGATLLIAEALGGGPDARLPRALGRGPGTFVSTSCVVERGVGGAWISIEADVLDAPVGGVVGAVRDCLSGLRTDPPDEQEWSIARAALFRSGVVPLATTSESATRCALAVAHGLAWDHWLMIPSTTELTGAEDLTAVVRSYFAPQRFAVAASGPARCEPRGKRVPS